jgi:hypothetical protein
MARRRGRRPHRKAGASRRIAALFALGSVCFAAASMASQWASAPRPWIGGTFFLGSLLFTGGAFAQFWEVRHVDRHRIDWIAAVVQLAGTLLFNLSTFHALEHGLSAEQTDLRVWTPDVFGSICFLVSSELAYAQVCRRWICLRPRSGAWRVAALNLVGSIAFGASAIAALVEPSTSEPVSAVIANATTTIGALCFLTGALLPLRGPPSEDGGPVVPDADDGPAVARRSVERLLGS